MQKGQTHVGDEEDDVVEAESLDHDGTDDDAQANGERIHDHEHEHSGLKTNLV